MFTANELAVLDLLHRSNSADLATVAGECNLARSSAHAALRHLTEVGVVEQSKFGGRTVFRVSDRDALERAAQELMADFRQAVFPPQQKRSRLRLAFTDSYVLPDNDLRLLQPMYDITTFASAGSFANHDEFVERSRDADVIVRFDFPPVDRAFLSAVPDLQAIVCPNCVLVNVDLDACADFGVRVCHPSSATQKYYETAHTEYAINAVFTVTNPLRRSADILNYDWSATIRDDLYGRKIGLVAANYGIGTLVDIYRSLGCEVQAANTDPAPPIENGLGPGGYTDLVDLWNWADVLVLLDGAELILDELFATPGGPKHLVMMSSTAEADLDAFVQQYHTGRLDGLAMDILPNSWRTAYDPDLVRQTLDQLLELPNVYITPEMSIVSRVSLQRSYTQTRDTLLSLAKELI